MRKLLWAFSLLCSAAGAHAQSTSHSWIDVTASPYNAKESVAYTLSGTDAWVNVTGNTTITVPHAMTAQRWDVFNSGTGNVSLVCDSGTINGNSSLSVVANSGKTVTTDGTNGFAH